MPDGLSTYITNLLGKYDELGGDLYNMHSQLSSAGYYIGVQNWTYAAAKLEGAANFCEDASYDVAQMADSVRKWTYECFNWIRGNWPSDGEEYELTLEKMLEAMYDSDKLRWFHFINYIDAMRAGIWNTEIYETHLAEWYRHFSE